MLSGLPQHRGLSQTGYVPGDPVRADLAAMPTIVRSRRRDRDRIPWDPTRLLGSAD